MFEPSDFHISAHAAKQFQSRIAPMCEAQARFFIGEGIRQATNRRMLPDGNTLRVRTHRPFPFEFRAICVFDPARNGWIVATILRGDNKVTRKRKHLLSLVEKEAGQTADTQEEICKTPPVRPSEC